MDAKRIRYNAVTPSLKIYLILHLLEEKGSAALKEPLIFPLLCHKSATMCQIDANKASNSQLKPDLCSYINLGQFKFRLLHHSHTKTWGRHFRIESYCLFQIVYMSIPVWTGYS